ncbi:hypothetical protein FDI21_gp249 [Pseudomonas phage Noxifer]|uniref:Uncharacterized protein n=1 Tax=Pseudomonas phage Noxifer TaxID=2006684 RepID=A0A1Y0SVB0_9CAUD|nr:hypothetical protein FDI21_gp249 [Pseudomonas phage Noxifer]ARV77462.1 hypothetical protein NOXIFER_297 [Pseudomonas phage Noxifer]
MNDDDVVTIDPELEMEDREEEDEDDTPVAVQRIQDLQREFIHSVQMVMEPLVVANPEHRGSIEATAEGILQVIEGNGSDEGYVLVKRDDANFAMVPCVKEVYEEHLRDFVDATGLDISVGLTSMFDDVNN